MSTKTADLKYTSVRRADRLEQEIENLRMSVSNLTEIVTDMRTALMPQPVDVGFDSNSPAVRQVNLGV